MNLTKIDGGVTAAAGFEAAGCEAGIKYQGRKDMAMIYCRVPCAAAGTFTSNVVKAAPVLYDRHIVTDIGKAQAIVINAGIANACTGRAGYEICEKTAEAAAAILAEVHADRAPVSADQVLVCSTGVIGMPIPLDRIVAGTGKLARLTRADGGSEAAAAIMTTDTKKKEESFRFVLSDGTEAHIGGMCKGSGMIHPNMCTMLSFITTDAAIDQSLLQEALREDIKTTYNRVSVDGDTSTNDTCLVLASGLAGNKTITEKDEDYRLFCEALHAVNEGLARKMAADGEGATMMFEAHVIHADTAAHAGILARSVISSNLTKAAMYGHDANWGRILCALGYAGVDFDPEKVDLTLVSAAGTLPIVKDGVAEAYSEEKATLILSEAEVTVICDMKMGDAEGRAWGCDLTYDYVKINGDYRS